MRRLGLALGVEAMSLHRYVSSRERLLDARVKLLVDEVVAAPAADELDQENRLREDSVRRLTGALRVVSLKYPHTFPMLAYRPLSAVWMRVPLRSLEGPTHSPVDQSSATARLERFPCVARTHPMLVKADFNDEFEYLLTALLERIALTRS